MNRLPRPLWQIALLILVAGSTRAPALGTARAMSAGPSRPAQVGCDGAPVTDPNAVVTSSGAYDGVASDDTVAYKGIPYAAAQVGALRWQPPQPPVCTPGVTEAAQFGNVCPQLQNGRVIGDEDCLTLNIWEPDSVAGAGPLPVMVFIHGGGNVEGSSAQPAYDGTVLAERGNVVVVTLNYRLGALGFLALPALDAESPQGVSGNYGLLDQIQALRWLNTNIGAFGGDPSRLLIFGESAGGRDVCSLVASPLAAGLFTRALIESGSCTENPLSVVESRDAPLADNTGCSSAADVAACLRGLTAAQVVQALPVNVDVAAGGDTIFRPTIDGYVLTGSPLAVIAAGQGNHVPMVIGSNANETGAAISTSIRTADDYRAAVEQRFGAALAARLLQEYPASAFPTPRAAMVALTSDVNFICPVRGMARAAAAGQQQPVFRYVFSQALEGPILRLAGA
ncbi:MAG TPA: carboxylesterase family protein, partial [Dehalococcoidia bacterium]|nr:carboxylesterase family protein [Dehalococcoidia bacterium]